DKVNLPASIVKIPESKHGEKRYISLNVTAKAALRVLESRRKKSNPSNRVMVDEHGKDYLGTEMAWFDRALKLAGIPRGMANDGITWHSLRHTHASWLTMSGVDLRTVQVLMGHRKIETTVRYSHLAPDHLTNAVNRLDKPVTAVAPTPQPSTGTKTDTPRSTPSQAFVN
ncbi:MAG: tyrosine-type recombinase/integrase, partial [Candidatus Acidiferrales bacterium]